MYFIAGAMRSTPTKAIQVELGEVPFDLIKDKRRLYLHIGAGYRGVIMKIIQRMLFRNAGNTIKFKVMALAG